MGLTRRNGKRASSIKKLYETRRRKNNFYIRDRIDVDRFVLLATTGKNAKNIFFSVAVRQRFFQVQFYVFKG